MGSGGALPGPSTIPMAPLPSIESRAGSIQEGGRRNWGLAPKPPCRGTPSALPFGGIRRFHRRIDATQSRVSSRSLMVSSGMSAWRTGHMRVTMASVRPDQRALLCARPHSGGPPASLAGSGRIGLGGFPQAPTKEGCALSGLSPQGYLSARHPLRGLPLSLEWRTDACRVSFWQCPLFHSSPSASGRAGSARQSVPASNVDAYGNAEVYSPTDLRAGSAQS